MSHDIGQPCCDILDDVRTVRLSLHSFRQTAPVQTAEEGGNGKWHLGEMSEIMFVFERIKVVTFQRWM